MSSHRGQSTVEYVGAIAIVALVMAGAALAIAAPGLPAAVVAKLRLGLCVVGADVCTRADADARGLEPCLTAAEDHERDSGISVFGLHAGGSDFWTLQRSSDGTVVLSEGYGQSVGVAAGFGPELGPLQAGGTAAADVGFRSGRSWVISEARLRELLKGTRGDPTRARLLLPALLGAPASTYLEGGGSGSAALALQAIKELPGGGGDARAMLGRRKGPEGTTYYADLGAGSSGPITEAVPGVDLEGHVTAEYLAGDPPVITLRTSGTGHGGEETQTVLRLALRDAADRAAARRVAFVALSDPAFAVRDLVARIHARGTVERLRYRTHEETGGDAYTLGLGVEFGYDHATSALRRELVDAEVLNGPLPARREDCLEFAGGVG